MIVPKSKVPKTLIKNRVFLVKSDASHTTPYPRERYKMRRFATPILIIFKIPGMLASK